MDTEPTALARYLETSKLTQGEFAVRLGAYCGWGVTQPQVSGWCTGKTIPSTPNKLGIAAITDNAVPVDSWPEPRRGASPRKATSAALGVNSAAGELSRVVAEAAADGVIDEEEAEQIRRAAERVDDATDTVVAACKPTER